jgi:hypothetical protein
MQVERHHIRGGKDALGQIGQEEFIDDSVTDEPDLAFLFLLCRGWVSGHNDTNERPVWLQALVWTVVKCAADPAFRAAEVLIGRQVQTSLDVGAIEHPIVFATGDIGEVSDIGDDRPGAILPIEAQQCSLGGKAVSLDVRLDSGLRSAQFLAILSIARVAKASDPLMRMHLEDGRACTHNFSPFASGVARSTEGTQAPLGGRPIRHLR